VDFRSTGLSTSLLWFHSHDALCDRLRIGVVFLIHILRHTFCSHLAMRGAPARAIQELAGHADLTMTQRYMHLSPAARADAIRLRDRPGAKQSLESGGDGLVGTKC
jgi:site-specific recombinase XerD